MSRRLFAVAGCSVGLMLFLAMAPVRVTGSVLAAALSGRAAPANVQATADSASTAPAALNLVVSPDDRENATPTGWWVVSGQTASDIAATLGANNARIVDLALDAAGTPSRFTVAYVSNTGAYAKGWWWYTDVDEATLNAALTANNARLISLKAYDVGGGQIRFAAAMIANTGVDAKVWWWYYAQGVAGLNTALAANNARLVQLSSYVTGGTTFYAAVMVSNAGADARSWWWYVNVGPGTINALLTGNQARLLDLDRDPATGNYNAVMTGCNAGCPAWWYYFGTTNQQMLDNAAQTGSRVIDLNTYPGCGALCYSYVLINNSSDIASRVGELLRNGTDGTKGLFLKEVDGPVLANLEDGWVFEPASAIKTVLHVYAMHQVQAGAANLADAITKYLPPASGSCPKANPDGTETLGVALGEMMRHSDNTRTREISDRFNVNSIINYAHSFGMNGTHIYHVIGCGGPIPNQTTLQDLAALYEKVANGTLLDAANRATFYGLMAGRAQFALEGYDWTGLWGIDIPNIINQEAPPGMPAALKTVFRNQMNIAYKAGNYKICGATCATYVDHIAIAGWAQIPFCTLNGFTSKQYVFGLFINNSTSDTTSNATFMATKAELLREQIRTGLASCASASSNLDIDGNGSAVALTDGLLVVRYLLGLTGNALTDGAIGAAQTRQSPADVAQYMYTIRALLDVDDNGQADALTDGLMVIRYLFGIRGAALIGGTLGTGAKRATAPEIEAYIKSLMP